MQLTSQRSRSNGGGLRGKSGDVKATGHDITSAFAEASLIRDAFGKDSPSQNVELLAPGHTSVHGTEERANLYELCQPHFGQPVRVLADVSSASLLRID